MHESQLVYAHLGYVEFDRRIVNGYDRIFVRKQLVALPQCGVSLKS
jgi:hypothetical protein